MTVKELKQKLIGIDENLEVFIIQENNEDFASSLVEKAEIRSVLFTENPEDDETAELACRDDVFVITDEI
ncbi:Uncharacterised protein [Algoriella xinjiangensis]|uniref:hypothetical protein n=1 Tax=Algoriella xinjiangensis TaxID=684065 RepID=UPI000F639B4F|nr:hypothetical protein [Algoriella xinjiangensis]VDH16126.1 Uncharacterised protein [Algoriella xinjiangensis]